MSEKIANEDRKYIWSWIDVGTGKESGASSITMIAMKEFGETGQYTEEECRLLNQIKDEIPCPQWVEWGHNTDYVELNRKSAKNYNQQIMDRFKELTQNK